MNREGVVQRRTARAAVNQDLDVPSNKNTEVDEKHDSEEESNDLDSKETRLTLMEEVLLLGLKDKEVKFLLNAIMKTVKSNKDLSFYLGIYFILE